MHKFYVTTPIYYVNAEPHIGHAYTTILADVLARYHRLLGEPTFFLTGTDEHGQKVQESAQKNNMTPQEHCDIYAKRFQEAWKSLDISNDDFIRTTQERHKRVVQAILQKLYESKADDGKPLVYTADYEGWYCKFEERYWTEKDLVGGNCPECDRPVLKLSEKNYFFRMSYYQDWLIETINKNPELIQPDFRRNEVLGFLRRPLGDLCISRPKSRLAWGIELPFDRDYVCYVWFDALINYVSAIGYDSRTGTFVNDWWPAVHLIGKDILTTHSVYWPCMLKAAGIDLFRTIFATGYWVQEGTKMSKSLGNIIDPMDLTKRYGADAFRFYVIREMTLGQDASYSEESFIQRYNAELANDLGNLLSRLVKMLESYSGGVIPTPGPRSSREMAEAHASALDDFEELLDSFKLNALTDRIMAFVRSINRYVEVNRPWDLVKKNEVNRLADVLYNASEALVNAAILLSPIIPEKSAEIFRQLGYERPAVFNIEKLRQWGKLLPGTRIAAGASLFPRLGEPRHMEERVEPSTKGSGDELISIDEFAKVRLRVAEVISAEKVKDADKLLSLQVKIGEETRQLVAGIAQSYRPEELVGEKIIVVTNLKPAKIKGIESSGMLLAATDKDKLVLLTVDRDIDSGASIS